MNRLNETIMFVSIATALVGTVIYVPFASEGIHAHVSERLWPLPDAAAEAAEVEADLDGNASALIASQ